MSEHVTDVVTGFATCWAAPPADRVSMGGLCEAVTTADPRGWFENRFQRGTSQINDGLYAAVKEKRDLGHSQVK